MPLGNPYAYEEDPFDPPPNSPPPTGGTGGNGGGPLPVIPDPGTNVQPTAPVEPVGAGGGGGGGGGFGAMPPAYPTFNIPGAPQFTYTPFRAPTMQDAQNEPGYAFRIKAGQDALERSAAAKGHLRTGGTLQNLLEYGQDFAAGEYQNVYNRALGAYDRQYRAEHDAYAPKFARWQLGASGERDAQLARYQSQLGQWGQSMAPRPEVNLDEIVGPPPTPPGDVSGYSGGDPWTDNRQGDPWTDAPYY